MNSPIKTEVLAGWRKAREWTHAHVARELNVSEHFYQQVESGVRPMTAALLLRVAKLYGFSLDAAARDLEFDIDLAQRRTLPPKRKRA